MYWFAPLRTGEVLRTRQRLCPDCLAANLEALLTPPEVDALTCSACGIDVEEDLHAVYVTYYPPKAGAVRGAMALCEEHALEVRVRARINALDLPDRMVEPADRVFSEPVSVEATYRALGRVDPGVKRPAPYVVSRLNTQEVPKPEI